MFLIFIWQWEYKITITIQTNKVDIFKYNMIIGIACKKNEIEL